MTIPLLAMTLFGSALAKQHDNGQRAQARADELAAREREDREFMVGERTRQMRLRQDLADAAAPVVAKQTAKAGELTVGANGPELAGADQFSAGVGNNFLTMAEAQAAAPKANTQPMKLTRMSDALERHGEVDKALALRASGRQEQLAQSQLDEAQARELDSRFDRELMGLSSHDDIASLVSGSNLGGSLKLKAVPTPDGKRVAYVRINPDGTQTATPYSFGADAEGLRLAKLELSKLTPQHQKLDYLFRLSQAQQRTEQDQRDYELRKRQVDSEIGARGAQLGLDRQRLALMSAQGEQQQALTPEATFDRKAAFQRAQEFMMAKHKELADSGKPGLTPQQALGMVNDMVNAQYREHQNAVLAGAAARKLSAASSSPQAYAEAYAKVVAAGLGADVLRGMGFPPPAGGATQPRPAVVRQPQSASDPLGLGVPPVVNQAASASGQQQINPPGPDAGPRHTYGLLSGPRLDNLLMQKKWGTINKAEAEELRQLLATKDQAWFRGRASEADWDVTAAVGVSANDMARARATNPQPLMKMREAATYGLLSGPRLDNLLMQKKLGIITPAEEEELRQLQATKDSAWFRGRASEANWTP